MNEQEILEAANLMNEQPLPEFPRTVAVTDESGTRLVEVDDE